MLRSLLLVGAGADEQQRAEHGGASFGRQGFRPHLTGRGADPRRRARGTPQARPPPRGDRACGTRGAPSSGTDPAAADQRA